MNNLPKASNVERPAQSYASINQSRTRESKVHKDYGILHPNTACGLFKFTFRNTMIEDKVTCKLCLAVINRRKKRDSGN
jgi:hypothetical protein